MERQKRWQWILITLVIFLTIYNILPTLFYYTKPLKSPIEAPRANTIAYQAAKRVNSLEKESLDWLRSFNKLLGIKASSITIPPNSPDLIELEFSSKKDALSFRKYLPRAGALIPFAPAQLSLLTTKKQSETEAGTRIVLQRSIPIRFDLSKLEPYFQFSSKKSADGAVTPLYHEITNDRLLDLGLAIGGVSENAKIVDLILHSSQSSRLEEFLTILADNIATYTRLFGESSPLAKQYFATFTQNNIEDKRLAIRNLTSAFESIIDQIKLKRINLQNTEQERQGEGKFLDTKEKQELDSLSSLEKKLSIALSVLRRQSTSFSSGETPWNYDSLKEKISTTFPLHSTNSSNAKTLFIEGRNPIFSSITLDRNNDTVSLELSPAIVQLKKKMNTTTKTGGTSDLLQQLIYNEVARIGRAIRETLTPKGNSFSIALNSLPNSQSFLALDLGNIGKKQAEQLLKLIREKWQPSHIDLKREVFPVYDYKTFQNLPLQEQKLGLVVYAPAQFDKQPPSGFRTSSLYVIAKGLEPILTKANADPKATQLAMLKEDFESLQKLLQQSGFTGYSGNTYPLGTQFEKDYLFEKEGFYEDLLMATRENFTVPGSSRYAVLEFTDVKQRILTLNRIETEKQEDLLKWKEDYNSAQVSLDPNTKYDIPPPTKNAFLSNLAFSFRKYFRGDERKILHWGLDLSGGKTVQIELRDTNNHTVTDEASLKQGMDELYSRVNKMGISEVAIRQEGSHITLDFPSAQGLSATELVKASSMQFHIVNEKFGPKNPQLHSAVDSFLQAVWNEAVVTGQKDSDSINRIAWKHLYGNASDPSLAEPTSDVAKSLFKQGLRLSLPGELPPSSAFNDLISKIAILRGDSFTDWHGQTHPLIIVMHNYVLAGKNLTNVHASYDPSKGNFLSFEVKGSQTLPDGQKVNPRSELYNWTSTFSKESIQGTPLAEYSHNDGWRMAVVLNNRVISAPAIESALRDRVSITGSFTQREANRLEADLQAGSLSFSPHILSEKNVSPELGLKDRYMGILATIVALIFVVALMVGYYRFSGFIASIAVLFNLFIIWATLQNLQAVVTLAGIAGVILTVGMAVDANVLVFERIREEFTLSGRIASAVHIGYRKAFSAILDSNLTTIIAALILLNFDSGPIKGFAVTLIIGILSSMFTALFMTRAFFVKWVQNPKHQTLKMASWIKKTNVDFLKYAKASLFAVLLIALTGGFFFFTKHHSILGMDFTGGYAIEVEVEEQPNQNYRSLVEKALLASGIKKQDFQLRELSRSNQIKIFLSRHLDDKDQPFYSLPLEITKKDARYSYEKIPRIVWIINALETHGVILNSSSLAKIDTSWTSISGQISSAMRTNAIIGLSLALLCILIYITVRFEFKYAVSATLGLAIDVTVTLSLIAILYALGIPIQIDLNTIAALMTIVGYSLNDTIIIFDRIREDLKKSSNKKFSTIINGALNATLSRTIMTSLTTFVVLLALLMLGGQAIFGLSLVMVIGVLFGTFSSLFVAAPLLLFFHRKEAVKESKKLAWNGN